MILCVDCEQHLLMNFENLSYGSPESILNIFSLVHVKSSWWCIYQIWNKTSTTNISYEFFVFSYLNWNIDHFKFLLCFAWIKRKCPNNPSLKINVIWKVEVNHFHEYRDYVGKTIHRLGAWPWGQWRTINNMVNSYLLFKTPL